MPVNPCRRCPVRRHRATCPSQWEGCADACSLLDVGHFRHELIAAKNPLEFAGRLRAAQASGTCDLVIHSHLNSWGGYGRHAEQLGRAIEALGFRIGYDPLDIDEKYGPLPSWVRERIGRTGPRRLNLAPPNCQRKHADAWFTMWESSRLPAGCADILNRSCQQIIVPCQANLDWLRASGVTLPIAIACEAPTTPGVEPTPVQMDGPTVFGAAGRMAHGGCRKGLNEAMAAFVAAFPADVDVRLDVKCWPDCLPQLVVPADPRVRIITDSWTDAELAAWYSSLTCYCTASKGEGWGLHTHEAMQAGRPAIATAWGGQADFFDSSCGWSVDYDLVPAQAAYRGCGEWAVPRQASMVAALRDCHARRAEAAHRGRVAAQRAAQFTHERGARAVLRAMGLLQAPRSGSPEMEAVNRCPHRGCKVGCQSAKCHAGKGDLDGGAVASVRHCLECVK